MDWDKLKVFYNVAESGSFTKASLVLDISQSAISRQISRLEEMLNTPLFYRHARGLTLTEQGETLFRTTSEVFSELTLIEREIKCDTQSISGLFTIVAPVAFGNAWVIPKLPEFLHANPGVQLTFKFSDVDVDMTSYDADVSISGLKGSGDKVISHELMTVPMRIYSSREYLLENGVPLEPKHLDNHKLVVFGDDSFQPSTNLNFLLAYGRPENDLRQAYMTINNVYTIARIVAGGVGIAMLPRDVADHCPGLVQIFPDLPLPEESLYYSYACQLSESKIISAFYAFISQKVKEQAVENSQKQFTINGS